MNGGLKKINKDSSSSSAHVHQAGPRNEVRSEMKFSRIPKIKWKCPQKFSMDNEWQVASGEKSEEIVIQMHREPQVVEAVYPNLSAIPPNPFEPLDKGIWHQDDDSTVPIIPIEEVKFETEAEAETEAEEAESSSFNIITGALNTSVHSQSPDTPQGSSTANINTAQIQPVGLLATSGSDMVANVVSVALPTATECEDMRNLIEAEAEVKVAAASSSFNIIAEGAPNTSMHSQSRDTAQGLSTTNTNTAQIPPVGLLAASDSDLVADAVSLALTAARKCEEMGNLIDKDLLIELLNNPELITELTNKTNGDTLSVAKPLTETIPIINTSPELIKKSSNDPRAPGAAAWTRTVPISGPHRTGILPVMDNLCNVRPISPSVPKPLTESLSIMSPRAELGKKSFSDHHAPVAATCTKTIPICGPHISGILPEPKEYLGAQTAEPKPVTLTIPPPTTKPTSPFSWPRNEATSSIHCASGKPDVRMIKRLIKEHGQADNTGDELIARPASQLYLGYRVRSPSLGHTCAQPFPSPTVPPFRDINFIKSLIKEHGEIRENQSGGLSNDLPVPELVQNVDLSEMEAEYHKTCFIKSLIKEHGDIRENQSGESLNDLAVPEPLKNVTLSKVDSKYLKTCFYFNSPQGCRKGSACLYRHIASDRPGNSNWVAGPTGGKRLRL